MIIQVHVYTRIIRVSLFNRHCLCSYEMHALIKMVSFVLAILMYIHLQQHGIALMMSQKKALD